MRLDQLHIHQHRHFRERSFTFLPGINLIQGPNEAGKTSLHHFLLYLLFGPEKKTGRGAEGQGWLTANSQSGQFRVERRESLHLRLPDGRQGDDVDLKALLGSVDRGLYEAIFAFDTFALHEFAQLKKEEIQERLFSAGVQGAGQNAAKILDNLRIEQESLWRPRTPNTTWGEANKVELELKTRLKDAEKRAREAQPLRDRLPKLEEDQRVRGHILRSVDLRLRQLDQADHAVGAWYQQQEALRRLAELPEPPHLPATTLAEVRRLFTEISDIEKDLRRHEASPPPDPTGYSLDQGILNTAEVLALCLEQRHATLKDIEDLRGLSHNTRTALASLTVRLKDVGFATPAELATVDSSNLQRETAARWARELPTQRQEEKQTREAAEREQNEAKDALEELQRSLERVQIDDAVEAERGCIDDLWQRQRAIREAQQQLAMLKRNAEEAAETYKQAQHAAGPRTEALEKLWLDDGLLPELRSWNNRIRETRADWRNAQTTAEGEVERLQKKLSLKKDAIGNRDEVVLTSDISEALLSMKVARAQAIQKELGEVAGQEAIRAPKLEEIGRRLGKIADLRLILDLETTERLRQDAENLIRKEEDLRGLRSLAESSRQAAEGDVPSASAGELEQREAALIRLRATLADRNSIPRPQIPIWALILAAIVAVVVAIVAGSMIGLVLGLLLALGLVLLAWMGRPQERARAEAAVAKAALALELPAAPSQLDVEALAAKLATARSGLARVLDDRQQAETRRAAARLYAEQLRAAEAEHTTLQKNLAARVTQLGLPPTEASLLPPLLTTLLQWQLARAEAEGYRLRRQQLRTEDLSINDQLAAAEAALGLPTGTEPSVRLEAIRRRLEQARDHNQRQDQRQKEATDAEEELRHAEGRQQLLRSPPVALRDLQDGWQQFHLNLGLSDSPEEAIREVELAARLQQAAKLRKDAIAGYLSSSTQINQFLKEEAALLERLGGRDLEHLRERLSAAGDTRTRKTTLEADLPSRHSRVQQAGKSIADARRKTDSLMAREALWTEWAQKTGLPPDLEVEAARIWLDGVVQALEATHKVEEGRRLEQECQQRIDGWWERLDGLARLLNLPAAPRDDGGRGWLDDLKERLELAQEEERQLKLKQQQRQEWEDKNQQLVATLSKEKDYFQSVLNKLNYLTMEEVEQAAALQTQRDEQDRLRTESEAALRLHLGAPWEASVVLPLLSLPPEDREEQRANLEAERTSVEVEKSQADTQLGALRQQLADAEGDQEIARLSLEIASRAEQKRQAERRYMQLRLASHLLKSTLDRFRKERQPEVLRRAGAWFSEATVGQYSGMEADESGKGLVVLSRSGSPWKAEELSKGTGGLLYLCLRLALAEDHARRSVPLPILLDEVLVHFDRERAVQAARVLNEVAKDRQILLFSCHDTTAEILSGADVPYHLLSLERYGGQAEPLRGMAHRREDPRPKREDGDRAVSVSEPHVAGAQLSARAGSDVEDQLQSWFEAQAGSWVARGEAQAAVGISDAEWNRLVVRWQEEGKLEKTGEKRGTRYLWKTGERE